MSAPASPVSAPAAIAWRTPFVIILAGCAIAMLTFGPRASMGFFVIPVTTDLGWGRDAFGFALAVQNLLWGVGQPFAGAVADRFGTVRVLCVGALLYAAGLALMTVSSTPTAMTITSGVLIGFGLSGCSFNLVLAAFAKLLPENRRALGLGLGTASGSFGQFLFSPLAPALIGAFGWTTTLLIFAAGMLLILPLSVALATGGRAAPKGDAGAPRQSLRQALAEAFSHRSYVLLVLGFFTCGFQLAFITAYLPPYLVDNGIDTRVGGITLAAIGLANIVGSISSGMLMTRMPKRHLLAIIYVLRSAAILAFVSLPITPASAILFGIAMGLLWLSTVPPTSALVSLMFGNSHVAMLYGFAFFSHQVGGFLGVLLGGLAYETTRSFDIVWWLAIALGVASAIVNLPIVEKPVARLPAAQPA